jgi:hypothetical protein
MSNPKKDVISFQVFSESDSEVLGIRINQFFEHEHREFLDVKFSTCVDDKCIYYSAIAIYKIQSIAR